VLCAETLHVLLNILARPCSLCSYSPNMQVMMIEKVELSFKEALAGIATGFKHSPHMLALAAKTMLFQLVFTIVSLQNIIGSV
jgi:hypothetical protein